MSSNPLWDAFIMNSHAESSFRQNVTIILSWCGVKRASFGIGLDLATMAGGSLAAAAVALPPSLAPPPLLFVVFDVNVTFFAGVSSFSISASAPARRSLRLGCGGAPANTTAAARELAPEY